MVKSNKQLKEEYLRTPPPMGVFLIRNMANDKLFVGAGLNLSGIINRHRFQLTRGVHPSQALQEDWHKLGSDGFAFEIVDQLPPHSDLNADYRADLASLLDLWLEKLQPFGNRGYNEKKLTRGEMLRRIAAKVTENDPPENW